MKKLSGLNIIKIIATELLLLCHYQQYFNYWLKGKINFFNGNFYFGLVVELFFMMSGILAYHTYLCKDKNIGGFGTYIKGKILRFFPMSFCCLTFLFVFQWILYFATGECVLWNPPTVVDYLLSVFFLDVGWGFTSFVVATHITWYISILLIMYCAFWIVTFVCKKYNISIVYPAFLLVITGFMLKIQEDALLFKYYPIANTEVGRGFLAFFLGILIYILIMNYRKVIQIYSCVAFPLATFALIYDYVKVGALESPLVGSVYLVFMLMIYPSVITFCMTSKIIAKISALKIMDYLEKVSFSVYLWHCNFLVVLIWITSKIGININHGYKSMAVFTVVTVFLSILIYHFIDIPTGKIVKRILSGNQNQK